MKGGCGGSCEEFEVGEGEIGDLVNTGESCLEVEGFGSLSDSWEPVSRKGGEKGAFFSWCDVEVGVWFLQFGGDAGGELGGGEALGNGDFERLLDRSSESGGGFAWVTTKLPREIEVAFVDGADFDVGGKIVGVSEHELREAFIFFEVAWDEDEIGAEAACSGGGIKEAFICEVCTRTANCENNTIIEYAVADKCGIELFSSIDEDFIFSNEKDAQEKCDELNKEAQQMSIRQQYNRENRSR